LNDEDSSDGPKFQRGSSMVDLAAQTEEEMEAIREAVVQKEGILLSVFDVLRRVPRRVLMVLKLNDLTRSLDRALMTTHSNIRVFLIMAKACTKAVWLDNKRRLITEMWKPDNGVMSLGLLYEYFWSYWEYRKMYTKLVAVETWMDVRASMIKARAWLWGLFMVGGFQGAHRAASGLA